VCAARFLDPQFRNHNMKKSYTTYVPGRMCPGMTDDEEAEYLANAAETLVKASINGDAGDAEYEERAFLMNCLQLGFADNRTRQGRGQHLYIRTEEFANWLVGCVRSFEKDHIALMVEQGRKTGASVFGNDPDIFIYHFPCGSSWSSFMAVPFIEKLDHTPNKCPTMLLQFSNSASDSCRKLQGSIPLTGVTEKELIRKNLGEIKTSDSHHEILVSAAKLVVSAAMYADCFPECIIPGVPGDLKHPAFHTAQAVFTMNVAPKINLGGTHASPCAHPRTHHWRVLRSERFVNKRWQAILIPDTYVRGRAKTILSPEEADGAGMTEKETVPA